MVLCAFVLGGLTVHLAYWALDQWEDRYHGERSKVILQGIHDREALRGGFMGSDPADVRATRSAG